MGMTGHEAIIEYLRAHVTFIEARGNERNGWKLNSPQQAVLRHGRMFDKATPADRDLSDYNKRGSCFKNALHLAVRYSDLAYAEGYGYTSGLIPIHHAWNVRRDGSVLDSTWGHREETAYVGIVFDTSWVCDRAVRQDCYGILNEINPRKGIPKGALSRRKHIGEPVEAEEIDLVLFESLRTRR